MAETTPLTKAQLYEHFRKHLGISLALVRELFRELERLAKAELRRCGVFVVPGVVQVVVQRRKARVGRNPAIGKTIKILAKAESRARIAEPHRSSKGRKLYAVRDASGRFKDIQPYERAHRADLANQGRAGDRGQHTTRPTPRATGKRGSGKERGRFLKDSGFPKELGFGKDLEVSVDTESSIGLRRGQVVNVFFGTDRKPGATIGHFTSQRSDTLCLGKCRVSVPMVHNLATIERPWWPLPENPNKHFVIINRRVFASAGHFWKALRDLPSSRNALVFIHGYNTGFDDAIYRTAQLSYDLKFEGATILYSWASNQQWFRYSGDGANNSYTVSTLKQFLRDIADLAGVTSMHVIAHSMGNRALAHALHESALERPKGSPQIQNLILTAPDIDTGVFERIAKHVASTSRKTTIYASTRDKALITSKRLQRYPRLGDARNLFVMEGIDTIDASAVSTDFLNHSYFGDNDNLLSDLHGLIERTPPAKRFWLEGVPTTEPQHWKFRRGR